MWQQSQQQLNKAPSFRCPEAGAAAPAALMVALAVQYLKPLCTTLLPVVELNAVVAALGSASSAALFQW
jgi:hypothetical protein